MYRAWILGWGVLALLLGEAGLAQAGVVSKAAREAAEFILEKFGREAVGEGAEALAKRLDDLAGKYGDEVLEAVRRTGPSGLKAIEQSGALARTASQVLARYGDEGLLLVRNTRHLRLAAEFGQEATEALVRHGDLAARLIAAHGEDAAAVLARLSRRNARRLAMMMDDPAWKTARELGKEKDLLVTLRRWGDEAMDFVWKNKGALAVAAVLISFLNNPEAYIKGAMMLPTTVAQEAASRVNWTLVVLVVLALVVVWLVLRHRRARAAAGAK